MKIKGRMEFIPAQALYRLGVAEARILWPVFFRAFSFSEAAIASRCCCSYSRTDLPIDSAIRACGEFT
ncbi:MAG TPA: hypothetical protein VK818_02035 [Methylomirabilota bacterium]|nr:hypothetical protein [Methylomirabilota bacterium]